MDINLSISPTNSFSDRVIIRAFKTTAVAVVAGVLDLDPLATPQNASFTDLDPGTYIVNTYDSPDVGTTGTLRHSFIYEATFQIADIKVTEFLKMNAGDVGYSDVAWKGYDIDIIFRGASGPMYVPDDIDWDTDVDGDVIGFHLTQPGDQFAQDEHVIVSFYPRIVTVSPVVQSARLVTDEAIISADTTMVPEDAGILQRLQGASAAFTVLLPAIGSVTPFSLFMFISDGGVHINVTLGIDGPGSINYFGNRTELHLAQGERAWVLATGTDYVVINEIPGVLRVGEIVDHYDKDATVQGCIFANGNTDGSTDLDRTVHRRLWEFVNQLDASMLVTKAVWDGATSERNKYHTGDGVTTFGIPCLYTDGYARGVDGVARLAASHQDDAVLTHEHETASGTIPGWTFGVGLTNRIRGLFNGSANGKSDLTGPPVNPAGVDIGNSENLTNNFGVYKLIRF